MPTSPLESPGLKKRSRKNGDAWYWYALAVSRRAKDYPVKTVRLFYNTHEERAARCRQLTAELKEWLSGKKLPRGFDGSLNSLIDQYQRLEHSPFGMVQQNTREDYAQRLDVLARTVGQHPIANLTAVEFSRWHRMFMAPGRSGKPRIRQAHGLMTMLRMLFGFGASMRYPGCAETMEVIRQMRFPNPARRKEALTYEQAAMIVDMALAAGRRSIALGQALQFEAAMRQVDVIGKWTDARPQQGGIIWKGSRWGDGLLWSHVSADLILKKTTSKTGAEGEWDLRKCPLVLKALAAYPIEDRVGPMIVSEKSGVPYDQTDYPRDWRVFADAAGVSRSTWNRDSRAGAITEGWDAGAGIADLQRLATHSTPAMTELYARNNLESARRVADLRTKHRKQQRNEV